MKKIKWIFILILLIGCVRGVKYDKSPTKINISKIVTYQDNLSSYKAFLYNSEYEIHDYFWFVDTTGKYQIGDELIFTIKSK